MTINREWKDNEVGYCEYLIKTQGNSSVGHNPKSIAAYLRLQSSHACQDKEYELSAKLAQAAMYINCDTRNDHDPDWSRAAAVLD